MNKDSRLGKFNKSFEIEIGLEKVKVDYESWETTEHFEFWGKSISETGFRSHFFYKEELEGKTIEQFALELGLMFNAEIRGKKPDKKVKELEKIPQIKLSNFMG